MTQDVLVSVWEVYSSMMSRTEELKINKCSLAIVLITLIESHDADEEKTRCYILSVFSGCTSSNELSLTHSCISHPVMKRV